LKYSLQVTVVGVLPHASFFHSDLPFSVDLGVLV